MIKIILILITIFILSGCSQSNGVYNENGVIFKSEGKEINFDENFVSLEELPENIPDHYDILVNPFILTKYKEINFLIEIPLEVISSKYLETDFVCYVEIMAETNQGPKEMMTWVPFVIEENFIEANGIKKKIFDLSNYEIIEKFCFIGIKK